MRKNGFVRPDPGPAYPWADDNRKSYELYVEGRKKLFNLGHISTADDWSHDYIYMDLKTKRPWYIVDQYNGGMVAFSIYGGKEISMDLFHELLNVVDDSKYFKEPGKSENAQQSPLTQKHQNSNMETQALFETAEKMKTIENPNCRIEYILNDKIVPTLGYCKDSTITVIGYENSTAEDYVNELNKIYPNAYEFVSLGSP